MSEPDKKKGAKRRKTNSGSKSSSEAVITDPRFENIQSDPRYRLPSKRHTHVKVDKRFAHMLRDEEFSRNAAVDRYGRKLARDDTKKQLERFYRFEEDDEDEDKVSVDDDDEVQKELERMDKAGAYDPARDGGFSSSSSESSSDEESEEEEEDEAEEIEFPNQEKNKVPEGEVTNRIAVVNLDWDHIRAEDLMAVFSSFLPTGGRLTKVSVYPSEFGRERMEREEMEGPPKELFANKAKDDDTDLDDDDEDEEEEKIKQSILKEDAGDDFDSTQLRKYQLERLRYFYAILTFSTKQAAKHIYDNVDGAEYLSSANFFDLRFVPDETDFSDDTPRDECERIPDGYKPSDFVTDALQHSKVKLTWDMDDTSRKEAQARAFKGGRKEIDENDLKAYLGSDSSDDEEDEEDGAGDDKVNKKEAERQRMRALLGLSDKPLAKSKDKGPVGEMEVTFSAGLTAAPNRERGVFENEPIKEETTMERYIRKERERRARRKAKLKASRKGETVDGEKEEDEAKEQVGEEQEDLGFDDPFFTAPENDAKAAAKKKKDEKRKLREEREAEEAASSAQRAELELLMVDDETKGIKHFDMNEIEKAEKRANKKKGKKGKKSQVDAPVDDFKVNVQDPRFRRLFENHEFAIDPTNPRFKGTKGMKTLLEEGRKRRRQKDTEELEREAPNPAKKKKGSNAKTAASEELSKLVERVKGKTKKQ